MKYYNPLWLGITALFISLVTSLAFPMFGYILANILFILMVPFSPTYNHDRFLWLGMFFLLAVVIAFFGFLLRYSFGYVGENLTFTIRKKLFEGIIYKHVSWFDSKDRAPGILSNILSEDVAELNGLSTETLAVLLEAFLGLAIGIAIAFRFTWEMALISLGLAPFMMVGGVAMSRL
jgi:ATP-binding cassette subfamily B (MDR/TAP) protein 1